MSDSKRACKWWESHQYGPWSAAKVIERVIHGDFNNWNRQRTQVQERLCARCDHVERREIGCAEVGP